MDRSQLDLVLQRSDRGRLQPDQPDAAVHQPGCQLRRYAREVGAIVGLLGVPVFVFHEGGEAVAARALQQIARLSNGAYCRFDRNSAQQLRDLLSAVAVYAAGGRRALEDYGRRTGGRALMLTRRLGAG